MNVEITYCAPCGYLPRAISLANRILEARDEDIAALTLVPGDMGIFDVAVDGDVVYSRERTGKFPEFGDIERHLPVGAAIRQLPDGAACPLPD